MKPKKLKNLLAKAKFSVYEDAMVSYESVPQITLDFPDRNRLTRKQATKEIVPVLRKALKQFAASL